MGDYKIESRNDFASGAYLIAKVQQTKIDKNALYTISAEPPSFILPFTYKNVDGEVEIVYEVGNLSKLTYFQGELSKDEYVELWESLLEPLLDCGDWFLTPNSFVLSMDHLYYDKRSKSAVYVYVPSVEEDADKHSFNDMAAALSKKITVSDTVLENKMLRSILEKLSPRELLEMLREYDVQKKQPPARTMANDHQGVPIPHRERTPGPCAEPAHGDAFQALRADGILDFDDIPEEPADIGTKRVKRESGRFKMFGTKSKKKKEPKPSIQSQPDEKLSENSIGQEQYPKNLSGEPLQVQTTITDTTESIPIILQKVSLKCVGKTGLPQLIEVEISEGDIFSIGRYDAAVGRPQSSFEFDQKTKAVSRRHAVIERDDEGYKIVDLSSRAGTFVDGQKLPPNTPYGLNGGTRVSFGNFGTDYIWDVSYHAPAYNR